MNSGKTVCIMWLIFLTEFDLPAVGNRSMVKDMAKILMTFDLSNKHILFKKIIMRYTYVPQFISIKMRYYMEVYSNYCWLHSHFSNTKHENRERNNDIQCASTHFPNWLYLSRYYEMACDRTFLHENWETCIISISKTIYVYAVCSRSVCQ